MKKSTKTLWIYTAVLFSIAILLILVTTFTQSKIVDDDGNLSVLGSLTATSKQKINNLQEINLQLINELNALKQAQEETQAALDTANQSLQDEQAVKEKVAKLYKAYADDDYETMKAMLEEVSQTQVDERIPTLYKRVKNAIAEYEE